MNAYSNTREELRYSFFRRINFSGALNLKHILLPDNFEFFNIDISKIIFNSEQNLANIKFNQCSFGDDDSEIKLLDAYNQKDFLQKLTKKRKKLLSF